MIAEPIDAGAFRSRVIADRAGRWEAVNDSLQGTVDEPVGNALGHDAWNAVAHDAWNAVAHDAWNALGHDAWNAVGQDAWNAVDVVDEGAIGRSGQAVAAPSHVVDPVTGRRRTVVVSGHPGDRAVARSAPRSYALERTGGLHADRTAMWAVLLCVMLLLVAITSH